MMHSPPWFVPDFPQADQCVISHLISEADQKCPQKVFAVFEDGSELNYQGLKRQVDAYCEWLLSLGVVPGDRVLVWLPNCEPLLLAWFAINSLGAVCVPLNTAARGDYLAHIIANSGARLMLAHQGLCMRLADIDTGPLTDVAAFPAAGMDLPGINFHTEPASTSFQETPSLPELSPWDPSMIIYTSGTTGPSKGVLTTYFHLYLIAAVAYGYMQEEDRMLVNLPLFHVAAIASVLAVLRCRGSLSLHESFDAKQYWSLISAHQCTVACGLVGTMAQFLEQQPVREKDLENPLRMALMYPISEQTIRLAKRYGFHYVSGFGTTELPMPLITDVDCEVTGSCGKVRSGLQWRLVDEHDIEVPRGSVGELVIRPDQPWSVMNHYHAMPEASAEVWRNGWFHSGDLFREGEFGYLYYVDRRSDFIRRRGENVSSFQIENRACSFAGIQEAAAVGVEAEHGEEEILLVVCTKDTTFGDPLGLFEYLREHLPHFMLPRYIRVMEALPKTPTSKVQKHLLRNSGLTGNVWDRVEAGIVVKRERL